MRKRFALSLGIVLSLAVTVPVMADITGENAETAVKTQTESAVEISADAESMDDKVNTGGEETQTDTGISQSEDDGHARIPGEDSGNAQTPEAGDITDEDTPAPLKKGFNAVLAGEDTKWQYAQAEGQEAVKDTLIEVPGKGFYYFDKEGYLVSGKMFEVTDSAAETVNGTYYALDGANPQEDNMGILVKEAWKCDEKTGNAWRFFGKDGKLDTEKTGQQKIGDSIYFLDKDGKALTGFQETDGGKYYFGEDGKRQNITGWKVIENKMYYFNQNFQVDNSKANGWVKAENTWYYFKSGTMQTGWQKVGKSWYYMEPETGKMQTGWYKAGKNWYYSNSSGAMLTGWQKLDGAWYYLRGSGERVEGWQKLGKSWYYLDPGTGRMAEGWRKVGARWYYMKPGSGVMQTGWLKLGKTWYYTESSGAMSEGWKKIGKYWYYLKPGNGAMQTGWQKINNKWYYLNGGGDMAEGWKKVGRSWYYLIPKSGIMQEGWLKLGGKWYYLKPSGGQMQTGWYQAGGKWYYSNGSGVMQTGWLKLGKTWYYLNGSGAMAEGWGKIGGKWYYLTPKSGAMKTGWLQLGNTWYYLNGSGVMQTGFQYIGSKQYYFNGSGAMLANGEYTINGVKYKISASGAIEGYDSKAMSYARKKLDQIGWNLRAAFNWSAGIPYYHNDDNVPSGYTHTEWYGRYGFENSRGDCYVMASTFYCMAKLLGYDVHYVEGKVPLARGGMGPHGWCEIVMNGTTYVFDPNFTNETGRNGYQITYGASGTWMYSSYGRVN